MADGTHGLAVGYVVQIDPMHDTHFGGCFMVVEEMKAWGIKGFVKGPGAGLYPYRVAYDAIKPIGPAPWPKT